MLRNNDVGKEAELYTRLPSGRVRCTACARFCEIPEGKVGLCGIRGAADAPQVADVQIDPALEIVEGVKLRELGLAVKFQHHIDLARDDRTDQRPLVGEIVG